MLCPKCDHEQQDGGAVCERCGVIFAKVRGAAAAPRAVREDGSGSAAGVETVSGRLFRALLAVDPAEPRFFIFGRAGLWSLMLIWGWRFMSASIASGYAGESLLHLTLLPFHEAGHVIFGLLGVRFVTVLGGTLGQLLIPCVVTAAFLLRRNPFGGSVGVWWLGESFMDVAIYADDARAGQLPLLGGVTGSEVEDYHDWEYMLRQLGWLPHDHLIARICYGLGIILMLLALGWGGVLLWRQWQSYRVGKKHP